MLELYGLDGDVAAAARALATAKRSLRAGAGVDDPLDDRRRVSGRSVWLELGELGDALTAAAREWVAWLTLERVLWPDTSRLAASWRAPSVEGEGLDDTKLAPRETRARMMNETDPGRRRAWGRALAQGAGAVGDAARRYAERRVEAARLLDAEQMERIELPAEPVGAVADAAEALLARTEPMIERSDDFTDALAAALGRDASHGWPARLSIRWLADAFRGTGLTDGLSLDPGPLPHPLGAASFARALGRFGAAVAEADIPPSASFVLWRAPVDLRRERRAALFAALAADPAFARRVLGLGAATAREQQRLVARALLHSARLDAARVLLRGALVTPLGEQSARAEGTTERALGASIPGTLAGVLPQLRATDAGRFLGLLLSAADRHQLVERFDEDWFANPRAARALREEHASMPARRATAAEIEIGLDALVSDLAEALG
jgi:hypothetical protein